MNAYGFKYRVELHHWTRSFDGDDWVDTMYWINCNTLEEAMRAANPVKDTRHLIETTVYDMNDSRDLVYKRDWISGKIEDFTLLPDNEYYYREYGK